MGFLERAIKRGVSNAVGKAVGKAIGKIIEPTVTDLTNKAANAIDQSVQNAERQTSRTSGLEGAFTNLERSMQGYANQMTKDLKVCQECGQPASGDTKFCPGCGAKLPEQTLGQSAVCPGCGKQNSVGTKFCQDCGTKLPLAVQEEQAQLAKDAGVLAQWNTLLPQYPSWTCGGSGFGLEEYEPGVFYFSAGFNGDANAAQRAVSEYRQVLLANGFRQAGEYPCIEHLYKRVEGVVYHADTEHCFDGDPDCPSVGFDKSEPRGGFDYVKPEPQKKVSLKDLFGL